MGGRGNIVVVQHGASNQVTGHIFLYSHWGGSALPEVLQGALKRELRWDDEPYLTRIIFCAMLGDRNELTDETGFGISNALRDNEHDLLIVDCVKQTVGVTGNARERPPTADKEVSFKEFCAMSEKELRKFARPDECDDDE